MAEASGKVLSAFSKLGIVAVTAATFTLGLLGTVYLSLRSPEIQVPDVVNKSYVDGTAILNKAGLDIRQRAQRYKPDVQPGVILDQSPRAGEVVKGGQTVAVVVSRGPHEGEQPPVAAEEPEKRNDAANANAKKEEGAEASSNSAAKNENQNQNQNRERRKNTSKNANAGNRNANNGNQNANSANASQRNQNGGLNTNRNANRNANINANGAGGANRNHNTNANANHNANSARPVGGANRRPPF